MISLPQLTLPSALALGRAQASLLSALGSRVIVGEEIPRDYRTDDTGLEGEAPCAVVLCESLGDLQAALRIAEETGVPVTPRGGGSGRTGGAIPLAGGIVLATRGMKNCLEFERREGTITVEPGMLLSELQSLVEGEGWFYPPDPNSAELCCLGGNVAENAAGPRAFKYGPTQNYVLGLQLVLPGGETVFSGRRTKKGVTGYDVTSLVVGSEGSLAAVGPITLRLLPKPPELLTLSLLFDSVDRAAEAVNLILKSGLIPRCIEFLDASTLELMRTHGAAYPTQAQALLLLELDGSGAAVEAEAEKLMAVAEEAAALEVLAAQSPEARARIWNARKLMSVAVRSKARHKLSEDVVVPRRHLPALVRHVRELGERHEILTLCYGHAGDGNLHVNFLWDLEEQKPRVDAAITGLFQKTIELGGTLSGEHGIGVTKAEFLPLEQSAELIALQKRLKAAFDPRGLMNPGKIFPALQRGGCKFGC